MRNRWTVLIAAIVAVLALNVGATAASGAEQTAIPLTRALSMLESGSPDSARIQGGTLLLREGERAYSTPLPASLSERALDAAEAGGVTLIVQPPRSTAAADEPEAGGGGGLDIVGSIQEWAPMALLGGLVLVAWLTLRTAGGARFKHRVKPVRSATRLDDVAGVDEIRDEVIEIAEFLADPDRFQRLGAELPRGVILHGPPGTGKTLLARAVAGEAGVPFFSASGAEFVEVYAGLGSKRIRSLFEAARKAAPAVVYIDEIDAVGARRTGHASTGEREQTLDQLLTEMDGFATDPDRPVVVLASTNRLDELDPALLRSGRFDRKIAVALPGREARQRILDVHLRSRPLDRETSPADVAALTAGMAGADLAALCNEASFEAARAGRDAIDLGHFRRALLRLAAGPERRSHLLSDEERGLVAHHEMGHAIVAHLSPHCHPVERVTVIPQGQALGITVALPDEDRLLATRAECLDRLAMMMAGRAAEELVFGEFTTGAADDLARAATLARQMVTQLGMGGDTTEASLAIGLPPIPGAGMEDAAEAAARDLVNAAYRRALELLRENRDLLRRSAELLMEREAIERDEIIDILGPRPVQPRLEALVRA